MTAPVPDSPPRSPLLSLDDALACILSRVEPLPVSEHLNVPTLEALGLVLAAELRSCVDVPPADNSAMDGYALRCADVVQLGTTLPVSQRIAAGCVPAPLQPGTAARIFTGGMVPAGADAVVMQEHCEALEGAVRFNEMPQPGQAIRRRGEDMSSSSVVLPVGCRMTPQAMGVAASSGAAVLRVMRRPRVALFSTGDELMMPGDAPQPGRIYNSNRYTLRALIEALGGHCTDLGIVPDQLVATRDMLRRAAHDHDLVLSSGGVSVGEEDHLRPAVQLEGTLDLWQMAIKPGKPLAFGSVRRSSDQTSAWFIGLPGNPVSSFVTFLLVVRPVLKRLQGCSAQPPMGLFLRADFESPADRRREFLRVRRNSQGGLDLYPNPSSGVLTSTVWADGLVDNPAQHPIRRGDTVRYVPFSEWLE